MQISAAKLGAERFGAWPIPCPESKYEYQFCVPKRQINSVNVYPSFHRLSTSSYYSRVVKDIMSCSLAVSSGSLAYDYDCICAHHALSLPLVLLKMEREIQQELRLGSTEDRPPASYHDLSWVIYLPSPPPVACKNQTLTRRVLLAKC